MDPEAVDYSEETPELDSPTSEEVEDDVTDVEDKEPASSEEPDDQEDADEVDNEPRAQHSPRYEKRIRKLSATVRELKTVQQDRPQTPTPAPAPQPQVGPQQLPPGDYSPEEIQAFIRQEAVRTGQALSSIEIQQLRAELEAQRDIDNVKLTFSQDLHTIENKYPELNEDSPEFDPKLSQVVTELYEDALLANPKSASLAKIAERVMSVNRKTAAKAAAQSAQAVAKAKKSGAPAPGNGPQKSGSKWTPEAVAALSEDEYAKHESEIKRDLYGQ